MEVMRMRSIVTVSYDIYKVGEERRFLPPLVDGLLILAYLFTLH